MGAEDGDALTGFLVASAPVPDGSGCEGGAAQAVAERKRTAAMPVRILLLEKSGLRRTLTLIQRGQSERGYTDRSAGPCADHWTWRHGADIYLRAAENRPLRLEAAWRDGANVATVRPVRWGQTHSASSAELAYFPKFQLDSRHRKHIGLQTGSFVRPTAALPRSGRRCPPSVSSSGVYRNALGPSLSTTVAGPKRRRGANRRRADPRAERMCRNRPVRWTCRPLRSRG